MARGPVVQVQRIDSTGLQIKSRRTLAQLRAFNADMRRVNERSVAFLGEVAARNLEASVQQHGRPQRPNAGRLATALRDPKKHEANTQAFYFMIESRLRRSTPYWRVQEEGTQGFIGVLVRLGFVDPVTRQSVPRDSDRGAARADIVYGGYRAKRLRLSGRVKITREIQPYWYMRDAIDEWADGRYYQNLVREVARQYTAATGVRIEFPA